MLTAQRTPRFTPAGLVADIDYNRPGRQGPQDRSLGGHHGTSYGAPALSFDGLNDEAQITDDLLTQFPCTVAGWADPAIVSGSEALFWCGDSGASNAYITLMRSGSTGLQVRLNDGSTYIETASVTFVLDTRIHVAVVLYVEDSAVKADVYADGAFVETLTNAGWDTGYFSSVSCDKTGLGALLDSSPAGFFEGKLSDWHVYDGYKATAVDVKRLYNGFALSAASGAADPTARWRIRDGSGNATDSSGNGKTLTVTGASWDNGANGGNSWLNADGAGDQFKGGSKYFDGANDYDDLGSEADLDDMEELTFVVWAVPSATAATRYLLAKNAKTIRMTLLDDHRLFFESDYSGTDAQSYTPDTVTPGVLAMVAARYSVSGDRKADLFIDGAEVSSYTAQAASTGTKDTDAASPLLVGAYDGPTNPYDGTIRRVQVYNRPLTDNEIAALYAQGPNR